jgi:AcrR family transcriptional regulator
MTSGSVSAGEVKMDQEPLRERNKRRVTQRIISAASGLFKTCGYHSTTMDDIAEKAEISRGTLFNYFPSKEALLLPWGQEIVEQKILPQLSKYLRSQPTVWKVFRFMFTKMSETLREYPDVILAFVREAAKDYHPGPAYSSGVDQKEFYAQVIRYGQERGEIRTDLPMENLASYLGALQMSLIFRIMDPTLTGNPSLEVDRLLAFLERGMIEAKKKDDGSCK